MANSSRWRCSSKNSGTRGSCPPGQFFPHLSFQMPQVIAHKVHVGLVGRFPYLRGNEVEDAGKGIANEATALWAMTPHTTDPLSQSCIGNISVFVFTSGNVNTYMYIVILIHMLVFKTHSMLHYISVSRSTSDCEA